MSGVSRRSITITRNPFGSVCSTGLGNTPERGAAGGGGVACGVCALTSSASDNKRNRAGRLRSNCFMLSALLCCRLHRFGQIVQNQTIRISEILFHHALNVRGSDSL